MFVDKFLQGCNILLRLLDGSRWDGMPGHRDRQFEPDCVLESGGQVNNRNARGSTHNARKDLLQPVGRADGLDLPTVQTVFKFEERLADWVREGDSSRIYKGDVPHSPSLDTPLVW